VKEDFSRGGATTQSQPAPSRFLCAVASPRESRLRSKTMTVFIGKDEAEDHVPEVTRVGG
jgi:hypothetical protein